MIAFNVNKSFIKFITDFGPLLIFLLYIIKSDKNLIAAIPPLIIATLIAVLVVYILKKKYLMFLLVGAIVNIYIWRTNNFF